MNHQPDPKHERYLAHLRKRRISILVGILVMALGYMLLAISPDTSMDWVLVRVVLGFIFVLVGFMMSVVPLLGGLIGTKD